MKRSLPILFVSILIIACQGLTFTTSTPVPIPTVVSTVEIPYAKMIYYDISGSTETELRESLDALAPVGPDNYRGDALTTWYIRWTWDGYGTEDCDLRSATSTCDIKVTLPRWNPPQDASPALIEKWNRYILALAGHEKGHVDNVIANLPNVIDAIHRATCPTAEDRAQDILSGIRQNDIGLDATTNHGETQGAKFP